MGVTALSTVLLILFYNPFANQFLYICLLNLNAQTYLWHECSNPNIPNEQKHSMIIIVWAVLGIMLLQQFMRIS